MPDTAPTFSPRNENTMNEDNDCPRCHVSVDTDDGCEPSKFCHHCAQDLLVEVTAVLRELHDNQNGPPLEKWRAEWQAAMTKAEELLKTIE